MKLLPSLSTLSPQTIVSVTSTYSLGHSFGHYDTHTHTHTFNGTFSGTTRVSRYQKGKTNLDFTEARDSEWQWHQLGHMQVCISLQIENHASTPLLLIFFPFRSKEIETHACTSNGNFPSFSSSFALGGSNTSAHPSAAKHTTSLISCRQ